MSAKRKKQLKERAERRRKLILRHNTLQSISQGPIDIRSEIAHIIERAQNHDARCVGLGSLFSFSTQSGDAWLLDLDDSLAVCLARDGVAQPVRVVETENQFGIEWDRTFSIDGDLFTTIDKKSGRSVTIWGYPIPALVEAIDQLRS